MNELEVVSKRNEVTLDTFNPRFYSLIKNILTKDGKVASYLYGANNHAYKHVMHGTPTYKTWCGLFSRCYNPKVRIYKYYGGRGITVCERWNDFGNFFMDMGDRPLGMQLDRIDNDKGYFPENCRWVTAKENNPWNRDSIKDIMPGKIFGKWIVLERIKHKPGHRYYLFRCECGLEKIICGGELKRGRTTCCRNCKNEAHRGWGERRKKRN